MAKRINGLIEVGKCLNVFAFMCAGSSGALWSTGPSGQARCLESTWCEARQ